MGCYFYIQDREVHTLGEEIRRMDMGLWPLLSRMYQVSCEEESHEMHQLLHSQTLRLEIHAPAHGGARGMRTAQTSIPWPPLGAGVHSTLRGRKHGWVWLSRVFLATGVVSLLLLCLSLCVLRSWRLSRAVHHNFLWQWPCSNSALSNMVAVSHMELRALEIWIVWGTKFYILFTFN